jgi:hypothetical protein
MKSLSTRVLALAVLPAIGACADGSSDSPARTGAAVEVAVAPLSLPGIDLACYDLLIENGQGTTLGAPGGGNDVVMLGNTAVAYPADAETVCSTTYGNGAGGAITYIATCDASSDSRSAIAGTQNTVTLWVDGLYRQSGSTITPLTDWQNPCKEGCKLDVDCTENADARVEFNLTIMREANQGFFDIAVNFEDIFCSAKLDSCYGTTMTRVPWKQQLAVDFTLYYYYSPSGQIYVASWQAGSWYISLSTNSSSPVATVPGPETPVPTTFSIPGTTLTQVTVLQASGGTPNTTLFGVDNQRDHTAIAALACTAGPDSAGTELLMSTPMVMCNGGAVLFNINLHNAPAGNGSVTVTVGGTPYVLKYGLYFDEEELTCAGGSCQKIFYNIALNIAYLAEQGLADCRFYYAASAHAIGDGVVNTYGDLSDPNGVYPTIVYGYHDVASLMGISLTSPGTSPVPLCTSNPLNGTSQVVTEYVQGSAYGGPVSFFSRFDFFSRGDEATAFPTPP